MRSHLIIVLMCGLTISSCSAIGRINMFSVDDERRIGREVAQEVRRTVQIASYSDSLSSYIDSIGAVVIRRCGLLSNHYRFNFNLVESEAVNAFAIPAGGIYINRGLLDFAETEGQLVSIMIHEIGHVMHRHGTRAMTRAFGLNCMISIGADKIDKESRYQGVAAVATMLTSQLTMMRYSRDAEHQADKFVIDNMEKAGFDLQEFADFMKLLIDKSAKGGSNKVMNWFSTHPKMKERLNRINKALSPTNKALSM